MVDGGIRPLQPSIQRTMNHVLVDALMSGPIDATGVALHVIARRSL